MYSRNYVPRSNVLGTGILAFIAGAAIWAIFGNRVKEKVSQSGKYQDLKREVYDKASQVTDITQEKYDAIVDEVSTKYAQAKGISQNELRDLVDDLKWHWKRIKSSWNNNRYTDMFNE
jgi:hypothetical protein